MEFSGKFYLMHELWIAHSRRPCWYAALSLRGKKNWLTNAVADPDLELIGRRGRGGRGAFFFFFFCLPCWLFFLLRFFFTQNKGGDTRAPRPPPLDPPLKRFVALKGVFISFIFISYSIHYFFCLIVKIKYCIIFCWFETFIIPFLSFVPPSSKKIKICFT